MRRIAHEGQVGMARHTCFGLPTLNPFNNEFTHNNAIVVNSNYKLKDWSGKINALHTLRAAA